MERTTTRSPACSPRSLLCEDLYQKQPAIVKTENSPHLQPLVITPAPKPRIRRFDRRSRNGCNTCKKRRVKCDESRPVCSLCNRLRLDCNYGVTLLWEDEAIEKGISFGRSKKKLGGSSQKKSALRTSNQTKYPNGHIFLNTSFQDLEGLFHADGGVHKTNSWTPSDKALKNFKDSRSDFESCLTTDEVDLIQSYFRGMRGDGNVSFSCMNDGDDAPRMSYDQCATLSKSTATFSRPRSSSMSNFYRPGLSRAGSNSSMTRSSVASSSTSSFSSSTSFLANSSRSSFAYSTESLSELSLQLEFSPKLIPIVEMPERLFSSSFTSGVNMFNKEFFIDNRKLEREMFEYFIDSICPSCICCPSYNESQDEYPSSSRNVAMNPYLSLLVPLALRSPIMFKMLVAVSLKQLELLGNHSFKTMATLYMSHVLSELPAMIKEKQDSGSDDWDDVLGTVLMLCFAEISANCSASWLIHLNGAKLIIRNQHIGSSVTPVHSFFIKWFVWHEIMGQKAWVSNTTVVDDDYTLELKNSRNTQIDLVMGCSPYLVALIHRITVLGNKFDSECAVERTILQERDQIEESVHNLKQKLTISELSKKQKDTATIISEVKKLATLVYLFARVDLEFYLRHRNNSSAVKQFNDKFRTIKQTTKEIQRLTIQLKETLMSILWPLFVIGIVTVETDEERWYVISLLLKMESTWELATVKIARMCIESAWKTKDMRRTSHQRWKDMIKGHTETISLA